MVRRLLWIAVAMAAVAVVALMITTPTPPKRQILAPQVRADGAPNRPAPEPPPSQAIEKQQSQDGRS